MAVNSRKLKDNSELAELRKECGLWLREQRVRAGLSQRELANAVGFEYYTFISQIESGRGRVPSERYEDYANAVEVSPREFATTMLRYNDPSTYSLIFDGALTPGENSLVVALEKRLQKLEDKLN